MERQKRSRRILTKILNWTERSGNALPHPATLFALFALTALLLSALGHFMGWEVIQYFVYMK
jgi:aminobenzoyl-glutamate transport protein